MSSVAKQTAMDPIVVTGATGRVGHLVVEELLALGCRVRPVGRTMEKLRPLAERGADVRTGGPRAYEDREFLATVFKEARAAFVLTPVDVAATDVNEIQYRVIDGLVSAIRDSNVKHVVLLSSWGAELETQVGGIIGCHHFEQLLDQISGLNVVHLRPVWFMENFFWNIPLIKMAGINGQAFKPNVSFPIQDNRRNRRLIHMLDLAEADTLHKNLCLTTSNSESATMQRAKRFSSRHSNRSA